MNLIMSANGSQYASTLHAKPGDSTSKKSLTDKIKSLSVPCVPFLTCELLGNIVFGILTIFMFIFLWGDPLLKNDIQVQSLYKNVDVYRARDPLNLNIKGTDLPVNVFMPFDKISQQSSEKDVYTWINEYFLPSNAKGIERQSADFTPLQATMLMMGCYGYPLKVQGAVPHIDSILRQEWVQHPTIKNFAMNFLLQALEDLKYNFANPHNTSHHDKSACSCLKDFANPNLFHLGALQLADNNKKDVGEIAEDVTCENRKYMRDSCSVQRVLDYALDGAPQTDIATPAVTLTSSVLQNMLLINTAPSTGTTRRHVLDPLHAALTGNTGQISTQFATFLTTYCSLAPMRCQTAGLSGNFAEMQYTDVYTKLKGLVRFIKPHNKLRPPQMCANVDLCTQAERGQGKVSQATYEAYIHKYRMAFNTCARDGVPQYVRSKLNSIETAGVYSLAEAWLLLAAVFAWTWAYYVHVSSDEVWIDGKLSLSREKVPVMIGGVLVVTAYVMLLIKLGHFFDDLYEKTHVDEQKTSIHDDSAAIFTFLWWIFAAVLLLVFGWLGLFSFIKNLDFGMIKKYFKGGEKDASKATVSGELGHVKSMHPLNPVEAKGGQPVASLPTMQPYLHVHPLYTGFGGKGTPLHTMIHVDPNNERLTTTLQRVAAPAQVAQDLAVIAGLTTLAIACVTQRGVSDVNVITAVSVWFFSIGLLAHLSNIMRLAHVYAQFHEAAGTDRHMHVVPITRTGIAIALALMLFVFLRLAGLDSSVSSPHADNHQLLFAVLSLLILCGADVVDAVLAPIPTESSAGARVAHFWTHMSSKSYYMAWLVLLSLVVLHTHRSGAVCGELGAKQDQRDFGAACYFAGVKGPA